MTHGGFTPNFEGLPRRGAAGGWLTVIVSIALGAGFLGSVMVPPTEGSMVVEEVRFAPPSSPGSLAEVPCPPQCRPGRG